MDGGVHRRSGRIVRGHARHHGDGHRVVEMGAAVSGLNDFHVGLLLGGAAIALPSAVATGEWQNLMASFIGLVIGSFIGRVIWGRA